MTLGILLGLFLGKQLGVLGAVFLAVTLGIGRKPTGATWLEIYGLSVLCGVGFTMSLFIGAMAFPAADLAAQNQARLGSCWLRCCRRGFGMLVLSSAAAARAPHDELDAG